MKGHRLLFLNVLWRTFFMEAGWNYERRQNLGFCFSIYPVLRKLFQGPLRVLAIDRHLSHFNTHPYLANAIVGAVWNAEESIAKGDQPPERSIHLKASMEGPCGALGDHVIWASFRPFCVLTSIAVGVCLYDLRVGSPAMAAVVFLAIYNLGHLWFRVSGLKHGLELGPRIVVWLQQIQLQRSARWIRMLSMFILVYLTMRYLMTFQQAQLILWLVAILLSTVALRRIGMHMIMVFGLALMVAVAMNWAGVFPS